MIRVFIIILLYTLLWTGWAGHFIWRSGGQPLHRGGLHGTCGKRHCHLAMVVVEDGDLFTQWWAMELVEAWRRGKMMNRKTEWVPAMKGSEKRRWAGMSWGRDSRERGWPEKKNRGVFKKNINRGWVEQMKGSWVW